MTSSGYFLQEDLNFKAMPKLQAPRNKQLSISKFNTPRFIKGLKVD
jgi:hypothetical protein